MRECQSFGEVASYHTEYGNFSIVNPICKELVSVRHNTRKLPNSLFLDTVCKDLFSVGEKASNLNTEYGNLLLHTYFVRS